MFKLLNRFAWVIAIVFGLQVSIFVSRYSGPFDFEGFVAFIFVLFIVKFFVLPSSFIESRLNFFADAINSKEKNTLSQSSPLEEKEQGQNQVRGLIKEDIISEKIKAPEPSKIGSAIKAFFSENLLAKLGGILVFLGVLFLLSLVYTAIGPIGKLIIGFVIGFGIYIAGVILDKKGLKNEGKILLGVGILINYLVILSGRYLIGEGNNSNNINITEYNNLLSIGATFLFLIFNTVFAVVTSLVYKSRVLLLFSFIFAFLNPLLVGGSSDIPFTLVGYSLIVATGGLILSIKQKDFLLAIGVFILSNILFLVAPYSNETHFIVKYLGSILIGLFTIFSVYKIDKKKLNIIFILIYVFGLLLIGDSNSYIKELYSFIVIAISAFVLLFISYGLSRKDDLDFLYSIGTIGGILTLGSIVVNNLIFSHSSTSNDILGEVNLQFYFSIIAILLFALMNWVLPFMNKNFSESNSKNTIRNLLIGSVSGLIFIGYELFEYGTNFFPGVSLGLAFIILAIVYFILGYIMINKIGIENIKKQEYSKNIIYTYIGISISIFSLAIAILFSEYEVVISAVWLFEASLMFYFYNKTGESKIGIAGLVLFFIGISKLGALIYVVNSKDFVFLIPFLLIFISFILNLKYLNSQEYGIKRGIHDISHIVGIGILGVLLLEIIPSSGHGWSTIGIAAFISILSLMYSYFNSKYLKIFFVLLFTGYLILQIGELESVFRRIDRDEMGYLRILQYISTIIIGATTLLWNKINKHKGLNIFINIVFSIYILIITSFYIYDIFNSTFAITIYWGVTASIMLFYGISKDILKIRTLGLYLITLTSLKIFLYDIWYGIDNAMLRVVALIVLGILFMIISTKYTKRYGNNIAKEFNLKNLK